MTASAGVSFARSYLDTLAAAGHADRDADDPVLPALSSQRRFVIGAESTGRRLLVPYAFTLGSQLLDWDDLQRRLAGLVTRHPALRCRVEYADGLIVQRLAAQLPPPYEQHATLDETAERDVLRRFFHQAAEAIEPVPLRVVLLRGAQHDRLVLLFDHSVIDETSLRLVTADLFDAAPAPVDPLARDRQYRATVWRWFDAELAAGTDEAIGYWVDRLAPIASALAGSAGSAIGWDEAAFAVTETVIEPQIWDLPAIPIPGPQIRGSLFPRLLAATHRALQQTDRTPSTVIYPWGGRSHLDAAVVGCFMNTVFSGEPAEPAADRWPDFLDACWQDFECADVPFDEVVLAVNRATRSGFSGAARCLLGLEDIASRGRIGPSGWDVAEWLPSWLMPKCPVNTTAQFTGDQLALRVVADPAEFPTGAEYATVLHACLTEQLSY